MSALQRCAPQSAGVDTDVLERVDAFVELSRPLLDGIGAESTSFDPVHAPLAPGGLLAWQPGGGYYGPPEDMLRVIHLHLDKGAGLVDWTSLAEMHTPQFRRQIDEGEGRFQGWGLGWMLGYGSGRIAWSALLGFGEHTHPTTFSHSGASSVLGMGDPGRDVAIVIVTSGAPSDADGPSRAVAIETRVTIANTILQACG